MECGGGVEEAVVVGGGGGGGGWRWPGGGGGVRRWRGGGGGGRLCTCGRLAAARLFLVSTGSLAPVEGGGVEERRSSGHPRLFCREEERRLAHLPRTAMVQEPVQAGAATSTS